MTVVVTLKPELHALLEIQARASGQEVDSYIAETLESVVSSNASSDSIPNREEIEAWLSRFDDWASRRKTYNPRFQDDRESIYPDRT